MTDDDASPAGTSTATVDDTTEVRADVCAVACAEAFRGDGAVLAAPMGIMPRLGALLAWASFEPDLLVTDGEADLLAEPVPLGAEDGAVREGWMPFREVFHLLARGRRHVMMGASQLDRHGNQNISVIGDWEQPTVQLLGARGAPGNTVNHATSYWVGRHSPRVFVDEVDFASGVGTERARRHPEAARHHDLRVIVTDLAVLDLGGPGSTLRVRSLHPGVRAGHVVEATGCEIAIPDEVPVSRGPTVQEQQLLAWLDPDGRRHGEIG